MNATETQTVDVMDYHTGDKIGTTEVSAEAWAEYESCTHPAYQWPTGTAVASDILDDAEMDRDGIDPETVIFLC